MLAMLQGRLALIGVAVTLTVIAGLWFRLDYVEGQRAAEAAAKEVALAANEANADTIAALRDRISRDSELLRELRGIRSEIAEAANQRRADLDAIAESDDEARAFLDMPVPDSLRNRSQGGDADGDNPAGD